MANYILKANQTILRTQGSVFQVGEKRPPFARFRGDDLNVQADGTSIAVWPHVDGSNNAVQQTATRQATLLKNALNGHSALRFDGLDDFFLLTVQAQVYTVLAVVRSNVVMQKNAASILGANTQFWFGTSGETPSRYFESLYGGLAAYPENRFWLNGIRVAGNSIPHHQFFILLSVDIGKDTVGGIPKNLVSNIGNISTASMPNTGEFAGDIAELILYDYRLTDIDRKAEEQALLSYYGL